MEKIVACLSGSLSGTFHDGIQIQSQKRRRQRSHGCEHAETAADVRRNDEDGIFLLACDRQKIAFLGIRCGNESLAGSDLAESVDHPLADYRERRHGLGRDAGFGDDIHHRVLRGDRVQRIPDEIRVDVVQYDQALAGIRTSEA